jgi:cobalt/nickel transport protein
MKRNNLINAGIILLAIALVLFQFVLSKIGSDFEGTDDQAVGIINEIAPNYTPWAESLWVPSGEWGETVLFALQTALGLSIIVFYFLKRNTRFKMNK